MPNVRPIVNDMNKRERRLPLITAYFVISSLLFSTFAFGQTLTPSRVELSAKTELNAANYIIEVAASRDGGYETEAKEITRLLSAPNGKDPVLIDDQGYARDVVLGAVAYRLAMADSGKALYRINWNAMFGSSRDAAEVGAIVDRVIGHFASLKDQKIVYLDDIAAFS